MAQLDSCPLTSGTGCFKKGMFLYSAVSNSAGSILDISKYRDTCERSISILDGIAIL